MATCPTCGLPFAIRREDGVMPAFRRRAWIVFAAFASLAQSSTAFAQSLEPPPPLDPAAAPAPLAPAPVPPPLAPAPVPPPAPPLYPAPPPLAPAPAPAPVPPPPPPAPPVYPAPPQQRLVMPSMPVMPTARPSPEEAEDSGLGLEWVWFNADIGGAYANMQSFSATNLALQKAESSGPVFGVAAGVRLVFLTLGVRARDLMLSSIGDLWELSLEAKFHTRIWRIDPYFGVRGGYNFVGSLSSDTIGAAAGNTPADVSVHGFNVGPVVGIDGYINKFLSIGVDVDAQFLFLQRPPLPLPPGISVSLLTPAQQQLYNNSGSSVGFSVTPTAHLGVHF